ncbi:MAG: methyltransferase domain-containing protein [Granulosicoccaceae bacterium]|jgi:S-adenosylmethionine-dependent methyltransferase
MNGQKHDRSFDDLVGHFRKNIYETPKGRIRLAILWRDLLEALPALQQGRPLRILDAGAGLGYMAGKLADLGHELDLCDVSADILRQAEQHLAAHHPRATYRLVNAAVQELQQQLDEQYDLVLFHAVLEWLAEPKDTLLELCEFIKPGGHLSLMFYNKHGLVYRHLLNANFRVLMHGEPRVGERLVPNSPLLPEEVEAWLNEAGLQVIDRSGVRVIYDYLSHEQKQKLDMDELMEMERRYSKQKPYADMARYQHFISRK